jgi:hypothetical protein
MLRYTTTCSKLISQVLPEYWKRMVSPLLHLPVDTSIRSPTLSYQPPSGLSETVSSKAFKFQTPWMKYVYFSVYIQYCTLLEMNCMLDLRF